MDEMKEIEKNEETGTPSETPSKPVEEPPILPSIEDVVIGYQVKKPVETQTECDVYSVVVVAVTKHNETAVSGDYYWMIADLDDCYEVQRHEPVPSEDMKLESLKTSKISQSKLLFLPSCLCIQFNGLMASITVSPARSNLFLQATLPYIRSLQPPGSLLN